MKKGLSFILLSLLCMISQAQRKTMASSVMSAGKAIYTQHCMTCHQIDGVGAQNMIPPLIKTDYVLGVKSTIIKILLNGMNGEIKVNGDIYSGEMPSHAFLKDDEIAAVLT